MTECADKQLPVYKEKDRRKAYPFDNYLYQMYWLILSARLLTIVYFTKSRQNHRQARHLLTKPKAQCRTAQNSYSRAKLGHHHKSWS